MTLFSIFFENLREYRIMVLDAQQPIALPFVQVNYLTGRVDQSTAAFFAY